MKNLAQYALAARKLRQEVEAWLKQSLRLDPAGPHGGGEDEANYALTFLQHSLVTASPSAKELFRTLLSELAGWVQRDAPDGYESEAEAHHGPEPYILFLSRYAGLFPGDELARALLVDAGRVVLGQAPNQPTWYDVARRTFLNWRLGTRQVGGPETAFENAEHVRFLHLGIAAHRAAPEQPLLDWIVSYGSHWAERLLACDPNRFPLLWTLDGDPLFEADLHTKHHHTLACATHHLPGDPLVGLETLLASGVCQAMLDLRELTGDEQFAQAARRIALPAAELLADPYAEPAADAVRQYRQATGDTSLDEVILKALSGAEPTPGELVLLVPEQVRRADPGVGRRADMLRWGILRDDGGVEPLTEPCPAALAVRFHLTGHVPDAAWATAAAARRLAIARRVLRGGREHADMGGAVCSISAGHGRDWGCGAVTGTYGPLVLGTRERLGCCAPLLEISDGARWQALPEGIVTLVQPSPRGGGQVWWHSSMDRPMELTWRPATPPLAPWQTLRLDPAGAAVTWFDAEGRLVGQEGLA